MFACGVQDEKNRRRAPELPPPELTCENRVVVSGVVLDADRDPFGDSGSYAFASMDVDDDSGRDVDADRLVG